MLIKDSKSCISKDNLYVQRANRYTNIVVLYVDDFIINMDAIFARLHNVLEAGSALPKMRMVEVIFREHPHSRGLAILEFLASVSKYALEAEEHQKHASQKECACVEPYFFEIHALKAID